MTNRTKKELVRLIRETSNPSVKANLVTELMELQRGEKPKQKPKNGDGGGGSYRR